MPDKKPETYQFVTVTRPDFEVEVRRVPTSSALTIIPVTLDQVGKQAKPNAVPVKINSLTQAFAIFHPSADEKIRVKGIDFVVQAAFNHLVDFKPEELVKPKAATDGPPKRNDLITLRTRIDTVRAIRNYLVEEQVAAAWQDPKRRKEIIGSLHQLRQEITRSSTPPSADDETKTGARDAKSKR